MTIIKVPRPPRSASDPDRPISSLLKTQIEHLHEADKRLPLRYRTEIYVNAIKTEAEAARYIREVTEAIRNAHTEATVQRGRPKPKPTLEIAASARRSARKQTRSPRGKGQSVRRARKS
jgi:hypothetical protein